MAAEDFIYVTVNDKKYRIGRIRANVGAILIRKIIGASGGDQKKSLGILLGGMAMEDELMLQKHLLSVVCYEKEVGERTNYFPIFDGDKMLAPGLETDSVAVWALQQASFTVNIAPFFIESGQRDVEKIMAQVPSPDSSSSAT